MDNRGLTPVVEKTVAIGLVTLFVAGGLGTLFGGAVPDYRSQAGQEVGNRVLATAANEIERAAPASDGTVVVHRELSLPGTIDRAGYTLALANRTLSLDHPDPSIGGSIGLSLPETVTVQNGTVDGGGLVVRLRGPANNRTLTVAGADR